jgi:hypothetical protein
MLGYWLRVHQAARQDCRKGHKLRGGDKRLTFQPWIWVTFKDSSFLVKKFAAFLGSFWYHDLDRGIFFQETWLSFENLRG